jgi:hypothetical protein
MEKCAFCPTIATLTAEHCWGVWISELMPTDEFTIVRRNEDGTFKQWQAPELNVTTKVVCDRCNNEWMSDLEVEAKATLGNMMLYGSPISLLPIGIASIAAFAFKGAVIATLMHPNRGPFHSEADRHRFADDRTLPDGFQIWISSLPKQRGAFKSYWHETRPNARYNFQLDVFTFAAGFFALQATTFKWGTRHDRRHKPPLFLIQNPVFDDISVPLWPSDGSPLLWPPSKHLPEASFEDFVTRWARSKLQF